VRLTCHHAFCRALGPTFCGLSLTNGMVFGASAVTAAIVRAGVRRPRGLPGVEADVACPACPYYRISLLFLLSWPEGVHSLNRFSFVIAAVVAAAKLPGLALLHVLRELLAQRSTCLFCCGPDA